MRAWSREDLLSFAALALRTGLSEEAAENTAHELGVVVYVGPERRVIWGDFLDALRKPKPRRQGGELLSLDEAARWLPGRTDDNKTLIRSRCPSRRRPGKERDYYLKEDLLSACLEVHAPLPPQKRPSKKHPSAPPELRVIQPRGGRGKR